MTEPSRCLICSAPHESCGPKGTGSPVDIIHPIIERRAAVASDSEPRWVNISTRGGKEEWACLNLRRSDPQWAGSLPKDARKSPGGGPVVREMVSNKARATEPGVRTAKKAAPGKAKDESSTEPEA